MVLRFTAIAIICLVVICMFACKDSKMRDLSPPNSAKNYESPPQVAHRRFDDINEPHRIIFIHDISSRNYCWDFIFGENEVFIQRVDYPQYSNRTWFILPNHFDDISLLSASDGKSQVFPPPGPAVTKITFVNGVEQSRDMRGITEIADISKYLDKIRIEASVTSKADKLPNWVTSVPQFLQLMAISNNDMRE